METPIDLATGQINQRDTEIITSATSTKKQPESKEIETVVPSNTRQRVSLTKSTRSNIMDRSMTSEAKGTEGKVGNTLQLNELPDIVSNATPTSMPEALIKDVATNNTPQYDTIDNQLLREDKHGLIIPPNHPMSPNPQRKPHQYEEIKNGPVEEPSKVFDVGPMYDDIIHNRNLSSMFQKPESSKPEEHKYNVLCSPTEMNAFKIGTAATHNPQPSSIPLELHTYETVLTKEQRGGTANFQVSAEGPGGLIFPEERPTVCTPKHREHQYEKVEDDDLPLPPRDIQREAPMAGKESADLDVTSSGTHLYNVLANPVDNNPLQIGVVKAELPMESSMEDKYYSTAQVHRLVPVGKMTESSVDEHLYQELDEGKTGQARLAFPKGDPTFNRHNTFTSSTSMIDRRGPSSGQLVRTYSESVERFDPMYDEPYLVKAQQTSADSTARVKNKYDLDSLFDDPKCAKDIKASPFFDDPKYVTGKSQQQGVVPAEKGVSPRHISMNARVAVPPVPPRCPVVEDDEATSFKISSRSRITK